MIQEGQGDVIPQVADRQYAYHDETTYPGCYLSSYPSRRSNSPEELEKYNQYELFITKHTDSSFQVKLRKHRKDIVKQRRENGAAIMHEDYITTLSFGELVNRIFSPGHEIYFETEAFPEVVQEIMKDAYI